MMQQIGRGVGEGGGTGDGLAVAVTVGRRVKVGSGVTSGVISDEGGSVTCITNGLTGLRVGSG